MKIYLLVIFTVFTFSFVTAQEYEVSTSMLDKVTNYFVKVENDTIPFFLNNIFNKKSAKELNPVVSGLYITGIFTERRVPQRTLNQVSFIPVYGGDFKKELYTGELSYVFSSFKLSLMYYGGSVDLSGLNTKIAKPPAKPNSEYQELLKLNSVSLNISYVTMSLFWGRVFPLFGFNVAFNNYKSGDNNLLISSLGFSSELLIKQRNFFVSLQHIKQLSNTKLTADAVNIKAGIFFKLF